MVSPEGIRPEPNRPAPGRRALFAGAALLIAVGFIVVGVLTAPEDRVSADQATTSTTSSTTTTIGEILPPVDMDDFTVAQIRTGEPLQWARVGLNGTGYPLALTEHDGSVYLFAASAPRFQYVAGGLRAWRSTDGITWEDLGEVIGNDYLVSTIASTEQGLVAVGSPADGSSVMVWVSQEGRRWTATEFADDFDFYRNRHYPMTIGANDDVLVVAVNIDLDRQALIEERLLEAGLELDLSHLSWGTEWRGQDGHWLIIDAPLGITALEIDLDELGLTTDETQWIVDGYGGAQETALWVDPVGASDWRLVSMDGIEWIESVVARPDGTLVLSGWSPAGRVSRQSRDGVTWTDYDANREPIVMERWGSRFIGLHDFSRPELLVSDDGLSWEPMGLVDRFPLPIQWNVGALGSGDEGIALSVIGYRASAPVEEPDPRPSKITIDGGHTLTLDLEERIMTLAVDGTTHSWEIYRADVAAGIEVDLSGRTVSLGDPRSGAVLAEVSFEDLMRAEQAYYVERFQSDEHKAIVFTADGARWTIQPAAEAVGDDTWVQFMEVASGHVLAVALDPGDVYNPFAAPGFELWVAEIP